MASSNLSAPSAYRDLTKSLRARLAVIADRAAYERDPQAHLQQLQTVSERIVELVRHLPAPVDPQLAHYLQRCSYDKALVFLEGQAP